MISPALEQALATHSFLAGMSPAHLRILTDCAMLTQFEGGKVIFHEGEIANRFYLILRGRLSLETQGREGCSLMLQTVEAGDVLGWSWLFAPYYWHFTACALEPVEAVFFYGTRLREFCEEDNDFGYEVMRRVAAVVMGRLQTTLRESIRLAAMRRK